MNYLTISQLAPFLAHGLRIKNTESGDVSTLYGLSVYTGKFTWVQVKRKNAANILEIDEFETRTNKGAIYKPIFRPLLDLTKEITHQGETFVPMVELLKLKHPREDYDTKYGIIEVSAEGYPESWYTYSANRRIQIRTSEMAELPTWVTNKLYSWHFDTAGLIEAGLAISIHDLAQNPYDVQPEKKEE